MTGEPVQVTCYSGHNYAQEPRAFTWQGERHLVAAVERTWRTPSALHFRVRTEDGARFELAYDELADEWKLVPLAEVTRDTIRCIDKEVNLNA